MRVKLFCRNQVELPGKSNQEGSSSKIGRHKYSALLNHIEPSFTRDLDNFYKTFSRNSSFFDFLSKSEDKERAKSANQHLTYLKRNPGRGSHFMSRLSKPRRFPKLRSGD